MKAIILAAGRGSRMGNLTQDLPKCLLTLAKKTILDRQIQSLKHAEIQDIAIVRGYQGEMLMRPGLTFFENPRWAETNMVSSLLCADPWLKNSPCLISYSDIVTHPETIRALTKSQANIAVSYDINWLELWQARFKNPLSDAETFVVDEENRIIEIGNRASSLDEIKGQYMGLLKITPTGWESIISWMKTAGPVDKMDMTTLLRKLIASGIPVYGIPTIYPWFEADNENDIDLYHRLIYSDPERYSWITNEE